MGVDMLTSFQNPYFSLWAVSTYSLQNLQHWHKGELQVLTKAARFQGLSDIAGMGGPGQPMPLAHPASVPNGSGDEDDDDDDEEDGQAPAPEGWVLQEGVKREHWKKDYSLVCIVRDWGGNEAKNKRIGCSVFRKR